MEDKGKAELLEKIKAQGDVVRKLKTEKAEKSLVRIFCQKMILTFQIFHHFRN